MRYPEPGEVVNLPPIKLTEIPATRENITESLRVCRKKIEDQMGLPFEIPRTFYGHPLACEAIKVTPPQTPAQERRFKILRIDPGLLMFIFGEWSKAKHIIVSQFKGVPEGAHFEDVHWCDDMMMFKLRISHASFEPVADGDRIPMIEPVTGTGGVFYTRIESKFRKAMTQAIQQPPTAAGKIEAGDGVYWNSPTTVKSLRPNLDGLSLSEVNDRLRYPPVPIPVDELLGIKRSDIVNGMQRASVADWHLEPEDKPPAPAKEPYIGLHGQIE